MYSNKIRKKMPLTNAVASSITDFVTVFTETAVTSRSIHTLTSNLTIVRIIITFVHVWKIDKKSAIGLQDILSLRRTKRYLNLPFLSYPVPLFQNESSCKHFYANLSLTCVKRICRRNTFPYDGLARRLVLNQRQYATLKMAFWPGKVRCKYKNEDWTK